MTRFCELLLGSEFQNILSIEKIIKFIFISNPFLPQSASHTPASSVTGHVNTYAFLRSTTREYADAPPVTSQMRRLGANLTSPSLSYLSWTSSEVMA